MPVEVIWSRPAGRHRGGEGTGRGVYKSGVAFPLLAPPEQAVLRVTLLRRAGHWPLGTLHDLRWQAKREAAQQAWFDVLCEETLEWLGREIRALRFTPAR